MVNFRWFPASLRVILVLQFTASTEQQSLTAFIVRPGDEVTLPCNNVVEENCVSTSWVFTPSEHTPIVTLVNPGRDLVPGSKKDRLHVPANCSLVIKEVREEDVGRYSCRRFNGSNQRDGTDALVQLSLINITERVKGKRPILNCSVSTYGNCSHTVAWQYISQNVDKDNEDMKTTTSECWATLSMKDPDFLYTVRKFLKCKVKEHHTLKEELFPFNPQSSGKTETESGNKKTNPPPEDPPQQWWWWWWYVLLAALVLAVLSLTAVVLVMWKRNKGNKTETEGNMTDHEDGVAYASINHPSRISSQIRGGDNAVTYTTVNVSSSSARTSADPGNLYATINQPQNNCTSQFRYL